MKVAFAIKVPWHVRWRLWWHGHIYVSTDYVGQGKRMDIDVRAITKNECDRLNSHTQK